MECECECVVKWKKKQRDHKIHLNNHAEIIRRKQKT